MIDLNSHLIPLTDNGSNSIEDTLVLIKKAHADGVTDIVLTAFYDGNNGNIGNSIIRQAAQIQDVLNDNEIPVKVFPGQQILLKDSIIDDLLERKAIGVSNNLSHIFVEFPQNEIPVYTERVFGQMIKAGITPIITYPERNSSLMNNPNKLGSLINMGAVTLLGADSYFGEFGKQVQKFANDLLDYGYIHLVASDAHVNPKNKKYGLKELYKKLSKRYEKDMIQALKDNAKAVLADSNVEIFAFDIIPDRKLKKYRK